MQGGGHDADAAKYQQLFEDIKAAFNQKYVAADGRIQGDTQCGYAMALKFELLPDEIAFQGRPVSRRGHQGERNHLSTGFVGVSYLLPVLTRAGKLDTAYSLLCKTASLVALLGQARRHHHLGTLGRLDPEKGFQNPGMNSFNHYSWVPAANGSTTASPASAGTGTAGL